MTGTEKKEAQSFLQCKSCKKLICDSSMLAFYKAYNGGTHLVTLNKYFASFISPLSEILSIRPQTDARKSKISDHQAHCVSCGKLVANVLKYGPKGQQMLCWSREHCRIVDGDGKCSVGEGKWATLSPFYTHIVKRDPSNFFPPLKISQKIEEKPFIENVMPTLTAIMNMASSNLVVQIPRSYQTECYIQAALSNKIIYLPTGTGKTLVAALMVKLFNVLNPLKTIFFVVDRVPLAYQQGEYLMDQTNLNVLIACGDNSEGINVRKLSLHNVIVITAQVLINWLEAQYLTLSDASLLIFDEIHHAVGGHAYIVLMNNFLKKCSVACRPRIMGLSASPATGENIVSMEKSLNDLCNHSTCQVYMPALTLDDMEITMNRPAIIFKITENLDKCSKMASEIDAYILNLLNYIKKQIGEISFEYSFNISSNIAQIRGYLRRLLDESENSKHTQLILHLQQFISSKEIYNILGPTYARKYIEDLFSKNIPNVCNENAFNLLQVSSECESVSSKILILLELLRTVARNDSSRAIIFVQTKRTAQRLCQLLCDHKDVKNEWEPEWFVGQDRGQLSGITWDDGQKQRLAAFKKGRNRLLISTDVLKEGFDVPTCNYVILFDPMTSLAAFIQSRGRARARNSSYFVICSKEEQLKYENLMESENKMKKIIAKSMKNEKALNVSTCVGIFMMNELFERMRPEDTSAHEAREEDMANYLQKSRESFRDISIKIYNLEYEYFDINTIDIVSYLPLINTTTALKADPFFSHKNCAHIKGSLASSGQTISEIIKLVEQLSIDLEGPPCSLSVSNFSPLKSRDIFVIMAESLELGALISPHEFNSIKCTKIPFKFIVNCCKQQFLIYFTDKKESLFKVEIDFSIIDGFAIVNGDRESSVSLYLPINSSPNFFIADCQENEDVKLCDFDKYAWERATIDEISPFLDVVDCGTVKINLFLALEARMKLFFTLQKLSAFNIVLLFAKVFLVEDKDDSFLNRKHFIEASGFFEDFHSKYCLMALLSSCWKSLLYRVEKDFFSKIKSIQASLRHAFLIEMTLAIGEDRFFPVISECDKIKARVIQNSKSSLQSNAHAPVTDQNSNSTLLRFVIHTPSRIVYQIGKQMMSNRITRSFNPDFFIRIQFRDEDLQKISAAKSNAGLEKVINRIGLFLEEGLSVGGRHYEFLAMSSSQLRDHGCWFVAPHIVDGQMVDADYIRKWCGNFDQIKNVAKYVARLGQSLSASKEVSVIDKHDFEIIPDMLIKSTKIVANHEKSEKLDVEYNFSDGIGMISWALADEIRQKMGFDVVPSAFQIRYAGFKGVLAVNPVISKLNPIKKIWFRNSMKKFESSHQTLEVLNWSEYIPCFLNRQIIMILSSLGVSDDAFMTLQDQMTKMMPSMLLDSQEASKIILQHCRIPLVKPLPSIINNLEIEPFFRGILLAVYRRQLQELLTRSRIFVPMGRILIGVIDESGTLEENEIFVQISKRPFDDHCNQDLWSDGEINGYRIVKANCFIAKNPCMHPGDIASVRAVNNTKLSSYYYDCIVFPRKGERPITNRCSGSDLDGDLYFVSWDPSLQPPSTSEPMDYSPPPAKLVEDNIEAFHIRKFFKNFISNDQLGTLANAHVARADVVEDGVREGICIKLAYLFSLAVDFPKTGFVATFPREARVQSWPDFMQKDLQTTHKSNKVIGKMYRKVRNVPIDNTQSCATISVNKLLLSAGFEVYEAECRSMYVEYASCMDLILRLYGIKSEAQIFSGSVLELDVVGSADAYEAMHTISKKICQLIERLKSDFVKNIKDDSIELTKKASCCYFVAYSDPIKPLQLDAPILSFPWIFAEYLPLTTKVSFGNDSLDSSDYLLGRMLLETSRNHIDEMLRISVLDRVDFFIRIKRLLQSIGGFEQKTVAISGSTLMLMAVENSDLNIYIDATVEELKQLKDKLLPNFPDLSICSKNGFFQIESSSPLKFTISNQEVITEIIEISSLLRCPLILAFHSTLLRWARFHGIVQENSGHKGSLSATTFVLFVQNILETKCPALLSTRSANSVLSSCPEASGSSYITLLDKIIGDLKPNSNQCKLMGCSIVEFLRTIGFELCLKDIHDILDPVSSDSCLTLVAQKVKECAFQSLHVVSQTMDISKLWEINGSNSVVHIQASKKSLKLLKKLGKSSTVFIDGSSKILFESSQSADDPIEFDLYQGGKHPNHYDIQCFLPKLLNPGESVGDHVYEEYMMHFSRQLQVAKTRGNEDRFGKMKLTVKIGSIYVTNVPRLFQEDGTSATISRMQEALSKGYKNINDLLGERFIRAKSDSVPLSLTRLVDEPEIEYQKPKLVLDLENDSDIQDRTAELVKSLLPRRKRKVNLTPMSSAFVPFIANSKGIISFLDAAGYMCIETKSGHSASIQLYDGSTGTNTHFQVILDDNFTFKYLKYRALRWMNCDVMSRKNDGVCLRFVLSSDKTLDLKHCTNFESIHQSNDESKQTDICNLIKNGIIHKNKESGALCVVPELRQDQEIMVRTSHFSKYALPERLVTTFIRENPEFLIFEPKIILMMHIHLTNVTEYHNHDPVTGEFSIINQKIECEIRPSIEWHMLQETFFSKKLIACLWTFAHFVRSKI